MTEEEINKAIEYNLRHLEHDYSIEEELEEIMKCLKETQQELQRKDNIINELKEFIKNELNHNVDKEKSFMGYQCKIILDKINELEGDNK